MNRILILFFSYNETYPWDDRADIAILKVNEPFILNEWVAPVRLPKWNFTRDYSKYYCTWPPILVPVLCTVDLFSCPKCSDGKFPEIQIWISYFQKFLGICGNL